LSFAYFLIVFLPSVYFPRSTLKHALLYENRHWIPNKWLLFEEIVRTIRKLHESYVVHRDLKPDNIFFNSELSVRVGDFGDACIGCDELGLYGGGTPNLGTQYYFAQELDTGEKITEKVMQLRSLHISLLSND
jgi:serine/threonine protein kinase